MHLKLGYSREKTKQLLDNEAVSSDCGRYFGDIQRLRKFENHNETRNFGMLVTKYVADNFWTAPTSKIGHQHKSPTWNQYKAFGYQQMVGMY